MQRWVQCAACGKWRLVDASRVEVLEKTAEAVVLDGGALETMGEALEDAAAADW